ncbi:hypothetical protein OIU79_007043 [Salix purpurea]|uniref:Uncharacterized protein n=1 Tax=Salix purpurea TaxID=77065 RepID=A0A9Q0Z304_SALPP|nr:hypothetical protein OIU79_007043 [Salix purpurea]
MLNGTRTGSFPAFGSSHSTLFYHSPVPLDRRSRNQKKLLLFLLSSQNLVFSKSVDLNRLAMSVVRTRSSCVAIRTLSPSTSINRSCAHGSASSGFILFSSLWQLDSF